MSDSLAKFQQLLAELFQFAAADLDFGIYRIMNHKRHEVQRFITEDLPAAVAQELDRDALAAQAQAASELQEVTAQIRQNFGEDALAADGHLAEAYHLTPLGRKYLGLQARAGGARSRDAIETSIYNHLICFFSRYYQDGDFISKRRYSKRERYAIPYNGEEVYLHWANHDQYYVKTAEHFADYAFTAPNGVAVHFKLQAADVEQNNVKGEKRFFLPRPAEASWDAAAAQLIIPCEYRPLNRQEAIAYGQRSQQEAIIARALEEIPKRLSPQTAAPALAALNAERRTTADGQPVTTLEHHLRQYTRRNTADFFIHKNLRGFLARELDFYLKNEVLALDDLEAAGEARAEGWFQTLRAIKAVGGRIVEFLHQIEEFQKLLWEKRKFVVGTSYCITVGAIDEACYPEIAACDVQWEEWRELGMLNDEFGMQNDGGASSFIIHRSSFLRSHPTLVLDTRHFDRAFVDRLLGNFDDLDEMTDGLLVRSENWQALNLLTEKYREQVKCIYIDPPYNTGGDEFIYKDSYQHSSWLGMMESRLRTARKWLSRDGSIFVSIDDNEQFRLRDLLNFTFQHGNFITTIIWQKVYSPKSTARHFSEDHDYIVVYAFDADCWNPELLPRTQEMDARYNNPDHDPRGPWKPSGLDARNYYSKGVYPIVCPSGRLVSGPPPGSYWRVSEEKFKEMDKDSRIWWGENGDSVPAIKRFLSEVKSGIVPQTLWKYEDVGHTQEAKKELLSIVVFQRPEDTLNTLKPTRLIKRIASIATGVDASAWVLDFFAGSGTTGHAVINLNREHGGQRKFILVEMAGYFDTVLLPRIKKVTFTPEWREGKPKRMATAEEAARSPRIVKVIRLESYEDSLNNIAFDAAAGQSAMQFDDYLLQYMLRWEARASETLLNVDKLASPFSYQLQLHAGGRTTEKLVDIPETFAYLLGLHVRTRQVHDDAGRRYLVYRGRIDQRAVAVIWRDTEGWGQDDYQRDRLFVVEHGLAAGADEVFVNGDSFIPNARALEPIFKARMFAPVEA